MISRQRFFGLLLFLAVFTSCMPSKVATQLETPSTSRNLLVLNQLNVDRSFLIVHIDTFAWHAVVLSSQDDQLVLQMESLPADRAFFLRKQPRNKTVLPKGVANPKDELYVYLKKDVTFGEELTIRSEDITGFRSYRVKARPGMLAVTLSTAIPLLFLAPPVISIPVLGGVIVGGVVYQIFK